jgi:hypothetical protein
MQKYDDFIRRSDFITPQLFYFARMAQSDSVLADLLGDDDALWGDLVDEDQQQAVEAELASELGISVAELQKRTGAVSAAQSSAAPAASANETSHEPSAKRVKVATGLPAFRSALVQAAQSSSSSSVSTAVKQSYSTSAGVGGPAERADTLSGHKRARSPPNARDFRTPPTSRANAAPASSSSSASATAAAAHSPRTVEETVDLLSIELSEHDPMQVQSLRNCVIQLGIDRCVELLTETAAIDAGGGLPTADGQRKRTVGGTFFHLVKGVATKEQFKKIFAHVTTKHQQRVQARRRASVAAAQMQVG